jgi:hypothetical protein
MADSKRDYKVGPGRPPLHTPLQGGPVRQPRQPPQHILGRRPIKPE